MLVSLSRLLHSRNPKYREEFNKFLEKFREVLNLKANKNIKKLLGEIPCHEENCIVPQDLIENAELSLVTTHPVHVLDNSGISLSPSSFIPFCWFGNHRDLTVKIDHFDVSVCKSFKSKLRNDQVCYEVDPNEYLGESESANQNVLYLIIDENIDRSNLETSSAREDTTSPQKMESFMRDFSNPKETFIFLDTIGKVD